MNAPILAVDDVYGLNRDLPLNYTARSSVDDVLVSCLSGRKHIVVYGSSKQGKTSLRKHCLRDTDYIVVQCSNKWSVSNLNQGILKAAGFSLTVSQAKTLTGSARLTATAGLKLLGNGVEAEANVDGSASKTTTVEPLELDPTDVNDLIAALKSIGFDKYVVLEDFHYLPNDTQRDFAVALKAIHESSNICCVIVGVWLEENRLIVYNGDLAGRVVPIDADKWTPEELMEVVNKGAALLNVTFAESFVFRLLSEALSSVYVVQEACRRACRGEGIFETQAQHRVVGEPSDPATVIADIVQEQDARYRSFIQHFADGFQDSEYKMYKWLLLPVLLSDPRNLQSGLHYPTIRKFIQAFHDRGTSLNLGNLTIALQSAANLQVKKQIKPLVLDYDESNRRLRVVDRGFLIWLTRQDRMELLIHAGFEEELAERALSSREDLSPARAPQLALGLDE